MYLMYVDVTPLSRQAPDGLYTSGKVYAAWVDLALPAVRAALE